MNNTQKVMPDLSDLWQQQAEMHIDTHSIVQQAKMARMKQLFYMVLDVLSLLTVPVLLVYMDRLTPFLKGFLIANGIACTIMVTYFVKLRWATVFSNHNNTEKYQQNLLQQLKNNARIAFINKHVAWIVLIVTVAAVALHGLMTDIPLAQSIHKIGLSLAFASALLIPWYFWASKRQSRFEREAQNLEKVVIPKY